MLAVLGHYDEVNAYHRLVRAAAGPNVKFLGAIYDRSIVQALRFHALAHVHGHQVGGTNPSLVEALGAGNPILAHDNRFNRWVAGSGALFFDGAKGFVDSLAMFDGDPHLRLRMAQASRERFREAFTWPGVLASYEALLTRYQQLS